MTLAEEITEEAYFEDAVLVNDLPPVIDADVEEDDTQEEQACEWQEGNLDESHFGNFIYMAVRTKEPKFRLSEDQMHLR